ncbi:hypothetical protein [Aliarcobacter cibarius]|uniref:Uncharacterized protein n=1 Tax=Aliarcobacter cibarius TaxID=255507 RepID=A0ABY2V4K8_9BACT|nr:hypothetical protein [Aliarcobacter cibarius]TLS99906.1 hypothetical protein FE247_05085 [Aliarcobacter cibarius]TLT00315.1 hypothetical protein FE245_05515 [Aliarcobacter cibarius]
MINLPIFRAKKLGSHEYVTGLLSHTIESENVIGINTEYGVAFCDTTTLSIHFPNMVDSQGNKIFASLSENGKGGDIIETEFKKICTTKYKEYFFYADNKDYHCNCFGFKHSKTIGIQQ